MAFLSDSQPEREPVVETFDDPRRFRLIGRSMVFEALRVYRNVAGIECVYGRSLDDKWQTVARIVDVIWL